MADVCGNKAQPPTLAVKIPYLACAAMERLICCPLAGQALPFPIPARLRWSDGDEKEAKILSKSSFLPRHVFFFPARSHKFPPKTTPASAGPGYFDRPTLQFT